MPVTTSIVTGAAALGQRAAILAHLGDYNASVGRAPDPEPLSIAIAGDGEAISGGLFGTMIYDWLNIELLFVPVALRGTGTGSTLLAQAEEMARARGCIGAWLDTFDFQARGFYEKLGYSLAGAIPDHPVGGARYFMIKRWGQGG